jgi:hypothetical protein
VPILDNPWFVGIVGGILSGIAATWISRLIFSKRDSREYAQKVAAVNREVIYSLRPGISEGNIPDADVLNALVASTCRKYGVAVPDAFNVVQISEELVKEVMDSSFISSATKQDYCAKLLAMRSPPAPKLEPQAKSTTEKSTSVESIESLRSKMLAQMSAITGVMVATLTLFLTVFKERFDTPVFGPIKELSLPLVVLAASVVAMMAVLLATMVMREARISARKREMKSTERPDAKEA